VSDICLFMSTDTSPFDWESGLIRRLSMCDWSHTGFLRKSDNFTFSAMNDGKGVNWREPNPQAKVLLLDAPHVEDMLAVAETQTGKPYNRKEIFGFIFNKNWTNPYAFDCDQLVFWSAIQVGFPLLNHTFIPLEHLTPRDILVSEHITIAA
jgi:hypothetical protein